MRLSNLIPGFADISEFIISDFIISEIKEQSRRHQGVKSFG